MTIADVARGERGFNIFWNDQSEAELPFTWLRDNDPDDLHPQTRERVFNLTTVELDISPVSFALEDGGLRVGWPNKESESFYPADWLRAHQPGQDSKKTPRHGVQNQAIHEWCGRPQCGHRKKNTNMTDAFYKFASLETTEREIEKVRRTDDGNREGRKVFQRSTNWE